ncbi:hypothetical protein [Microbacterium jejuense]|uniref:hypothetical protein n=1 Tax=Microbacterium jejuense TaxID=1263637 RepID=UPI0031EF9298
MAQTWKMAVIMASDGSQGAAPFALSTVTAYLEADAHSMRRYWSEMTYGALEIVFDYLPAVTFAPTKAEIDDSAAKGEAYRYVTARCATREVGKVDWSQYDSVTVFVDGSLQDSGSGELALGGKAMPFTVHNTYWDNNRTFLAHEIGHQLAFDHSYGVYTFDTLVPGTTTNEVFHDHAYGAPVDIMSAQNFAGAVPIFNTPDAAGWPQTFIHGVDAAGNATFVPHAHGVATGPALSRALLHHHRKEWFRPDLFREVVLSGAQTTAAAPLAPTLGAVPGIQLLVVDPPARPDGSCPDRIYVEYRAGSPAAVAGKPSEWDSGLTPGQGDCEPGVVVWTRTTAKNMGTHVWWRGMVPVPQGVDRDLRIDDSGYRVRVSGVRDDGRVDVRVEPDVAPSIRLWRNDSSEISGSRDVPEVIDFGKCGTARSATWIYQTTTVLTVSTDGLGGSGRTDQNASSAPEKVTVTWSIDGVPITATPRAHGARTVTRGGTPLSIVWELDTNSLTLRTTGISIDVSIPISVTVTDADRRAVSSEARFTPLPDFVGVHPVEGFRVALCQIGGLLREKDRRPVPPVLEHPDWLTENLRDLVSIVAILGRTRSLGRVKARLQQLVLAVDLEQQG